MSEESKLILLSAGGAGGHLFPAPCPEAHFRPGTGKCAWDIIKKESRRLI